ncbi:MAG: dihydroneopterin aldolase [Fibrobacteres bacterium]|nr:dihydroneopterin aldolase [Fibrobacterota bacterium]
MDTITIRDLALRAIIGIYPEERKEKQDIILNISMEVDLSRAGESDDINDTVDYKTMKKRIMTLVEKSEYKLIETLAAKIAEICLSDEKVNRAAVTVDKPGALRFARSVSVTVDRKKD